MTLGIKYMIINLPHVDCFMDLLFFIVSINDSGMLLVRADKAIEYI